MFKKLILPIIITGAFAMLPACNSSSDDEGGEYEASSSVQVLSFYINDNHKVLDSLSNVFFTIDLDNAEIFNADSLPYGTNVSRLLPNITAVKSAKVVELQFPREGKSDSIVNYLKTTTDSIDFSLGAVKLRIVSESGLVECTYNINVNVHKIKPDTLAWAKMENMQLPTDFAEIDAMRAVALGDTYYCLTQSGDNYCLASTQDPDAAAWQTESVSFPFTPEVESLSATSEAFYMLGEDGALYTSTDFGSWSSTGETWSGIYGAYQDIMLGCKEDNGSWTIVGYPGGYTAQMPDGFPVKGASQPATIYLSMAYAPQFVITGGQLADGKFTNVSWGFDGQNWMQLTREGKGIGEGLADMAVVQYDLFQVPSSTWRPVEYPALLAFGGVNAQGKVSEKVYLSKDWGMTWSVAPDLLQLPAALPKVSGASVFVYASTMHASRSTGAWSPVGLRKLPANCQWELPTSRVSAPIDEWECPAIYMLGGTDQQGRVVPEIWRGIIVRYTFAPKY